jgi:4-aminobutyrate aminotransferase
MDSIGANSISTFGGNPLASVAALANLRYLIDNDLQTNARKLGEHCLGALREIAENHPIVGEVRGKGLLIAIELVGPGKSPDSGAAARLMEECRSRGLLAGKGGLYGNVIRLAPPLSLTMEEADLGIQIIGEALTALADRESDSP